MPSIRSGFLTFLKALWDADRDTGVQVEKTSDDDTVRIDAGGNTDVVKVTATKVTINDDNDDVDTEIAGDSMNNVFLVDAGNDGVAMGGTKSTFVRSGNTIKSAFVSVKPDLANWNAGAQAIYTTEALRTADFSLLKARGTEASPSAVVSGDDISMLRWEGHDGTDFEVSALIRAAVDGAVSAGVVPGALYISVADTSGVLQTLISLRSSKFIGISGRVTPLSGLDLAGSLGLTRRAVSTDTSTADTDVIIATTSTSAARTHTLRTADTVGRRIAIFKDEGGNAGTNIHTITTEGSQLIDGNDTTTIDRNYGHAILYSNGSNWFTIAKSTDPTKRKVTRLAASTLTLTRVNEMVIVDYTVTGAATLTLPACSTMWDSVTGEGKSVVIKDGGCNASVNNITINRAGSDTILSDVTGDTSVTISSNGGSMTITAVSATEYAIT